MAFAILKLGTKISSCDVCVCNDEFGSFFKKLLKIDFQNNFFSFKKHLIIFYKNIISPTPHQIMSLVVILIVYVVIRYISSTFKNHYILCFFKM